MRALPGNERRNRGGRATTRADTAEGQRERILEATAELVSEGGYAGLKLEPLLANAGVGLPTLRKLYGDKRGCYLAVLDRGLGESVRRSREAFEGHPGSRAEKVRAAIGALFALFAAQPATARACLIEPFAAGPEAIDRYRRALVGLAATLRPGSGRGGARAEPSDTLEHGLAAAVLWFPAGCLLDNQAERIPALTERVAEFVMGSDLTDESPTRQVGRRPPKSRTAAETGQGRNGQGRQPTLGPLPAGRHKLAREVVVSSQRERLLAAVAEVVAEQGYAAVRLADIVGRAKVSRRVFYANFESKEACFLGAWKIVAGHLGELAAGAAAETDDPAAGTLAGLQAVLDFLATEPGLARFCLVEGLAAGPTAVERYHDAVAGFAGALNGRFAEAGKGPLAEGSAEMAMGSTATALSLRVAVAGVEDLSALGSELGWLLLRPLRTKTARGGR